MVQCEREWVEVLEEWGEVDSRATGGERHSLLHSISVELIGAQERRIAELEAQVRDLTNHRGERRRCRSHAGFFVPTAPGIEHCWECLDLHNTGKIDLAAWERIYHAWREATRRGIPGSLPSPNAVARVSQELQDGAQYRTVGKWMSHPQNQEAIQSLWKVSQADRDSLILEVPDHAPKVMEQPWCLPGVNAEEVEETFF